MSKEFSSFLIGGKDGLFDIFTGGDVIIRSTKNGKIPLVSHQHEDNGIAKYIQPLNDRTLYCHKSTIALADRGVFLATCQNEDFHIGTRVKALCFKTGVKSKRVRLYFVAAINKLQISFTEYSSNATDKLPNLKITLPVTTDGSIDYEYMEEVILEIEKELKLELEKHLKLIC
ncbi:restriction endonuclease subunit S [Alteromonas macleodii]|uniref:restriction endonuclease subunit S n=1 Tax=Alteromonas macleodii TaxID=28108 RepID=UPI003BF8BC1A